MPVNPSDKPFGAIAHPYIDNIGAHIFLTFCSERVT